MAPLVVLLVTGQDKMKMNKGARTKKRLMSSAELKKCTGAARILLDAGLISNKRADMIARNYR